MEGDGRFAVRAWAGAVEGRASARLPFEPKDWLLDYRDALRRALAELRPEAGRCLVASYTAPDAARCDVENVLLYNVGNSAFSHLRLERIVLGRHIAQAAGVVALDGPMVHHHHYALQTAGPGPASQTVELASIHGVPLTMPLRVGQVWWEAHGRVQGAQQGPDASAALRLSLVVRRPPRTERPTLTSMTKLVTDGVMAAFSAHDGTDLELVAARLSARLAVPVDHVSEALTPALAPLGTRRLLWPFRGFVQWNPADDLLQDLDLQVVDGPRWEVDAHLTVLL